VTVPEIVEIESTDDFDRLGESWNDLAGRVEGSSYFQTADWVSAWWDTLGERPPTTVAMWAASDGRLEALAAISKVRERIHRKVVVPVSYWTNAGSGAGAADHVGFLCSTQTVEALRAWLSGLEGSLLIRNVAPEAGYLPPEAVEIDSVACPRLAIPPEDEPIGRSANYRKRLRRNSRILRERGIDFQPVAGPDITEHMLDRLMEMHEVRSDDRGWGSSFTPDRVAFHRTLIAKSTKRRGPGMMLARADDEIVGVLYGFWWGRSFSYFQTGWDPTWWELSLGSALVYEMILHARQEGATTFDFLRGAEEYKYRFGAEDQVDSDWLVARGPSGRALAAKARMR